MTLGAGLLAWIAWLVWRIGWSRAGAPLWLWLPALAVELGAVAGAALLAWALWPRGDDGSVDADAGTGKVDAVVRVGDHRDDEARATMIALASVRGLASTTVIDLAARPSIAAIAAEFGAAYVAPDPDDFNGLAAAMQSGTQPCLLLLDAGDVPAPHIARSLRTEMRDPSVAVVQGLGVAAPGDSPEHGPTGEHDLRFERTALNPALGRLGVAVWTGSGSLVRRCALADLQLGPEPPAEVHVLAAAALVRRGWRIVAPGGPPVVALRSLTRPDDIYDDRVRRARAARHLIFGAGGALRPGAPALRQRAAVLAWSVRPLSGLRRGLFLAVLLGAIQAGRLPFHAEGWAIAALWAPAFVLTGLGLWSLSGWTLRPGDRTRWSLQTLGAAYRSLVERDPVPSSRPVVLASAEGRHRSALVGSVVVLSAVMALRGISEQFTHALRPLDHTALAGLTAVALWTLGLSLDALRMLARRDRLRRVPRFASTLPAQLGSQVVTIADLTPLGAGLAAGPDRDDDATLHVGQRLALSATLSTPSGCTDVELDSIVRNLRRAVDGTWRIGVEFGVLLPEAANALAELCSVQPARLVLAGDVPLVPEPAGFAATDGGDGRRLLLRLTALVAVAGAVATTAPGQVSAAATGARILSGEVVVDVGDPPDPTAPPTTDAPDVPDAPDEIVVVAVCSTDPGPDGTYGTLDDEFGQPVSTVVGADGTYELTLDGEACWAGVDPPEGFVPADEPAPADSGVESWPVRTIDVSLPSPTFDVVLREIDRSAPQDAPFPDGARAAIRVDEAGRWVPSPDRPSVAAAAPEQVLPLPDRDATSPRQRRADSPIVVVTLMLAAGLAASIALGSARPRRRGGTPPVHDSPQSNSSGSASPDLAIR